MARPGNDLSLSPLISPTLIAGTGRTISCGGGSLRPQAENQSDENSKNEITKSLASRRGNSLTISMCVSGISPLCKRGEGGISNRRQRKIPLNPPLSKGDCNRRHLLNLL